MAKSGNVSAQPRGQENKAKLTWHAQQHKVPRSRIVQDLQLSEVAGHDLFHDLVVVALPPRVADIVDANPDGEQRIVAPGRIAGLLGNAAAELRHLVNEAQDSGRVRLDDGGVGRRAAVGEVVGQESRSVVLGGEETDPVQAAAGSPTW